MNSPRNDGDFRGFVVVVREKDRRLKGLQQLSERYIPLISEFIGEGSRCTVVGIQNRFRVPDCDDDSLQSLPKMCTRIPVGCYRTILRMYFSIP